MPASILDSTVRFFAENMPDARGLALGGPAALAWAGVCLYFAGWLKTRGELKTAYTRKVFHFLIFGSVVAVQTVWGVAGVFVFGGGTSLVIAYALLRGTGYGMYEAIAREKDAPLRTYYVVVPYFATLAGGLLSNFLFPSTAVLGYLVTGLGDAVAEPVGMRFGRHEYRVPSVAGIPAVRTWEGSCAVFAASALALTVYFGCLPGYDLSAASFFALLLIALVSALVEAVSPHGWDNALLQVVPALLGAVLL